MASIKSEISKGVFWIALAKYSGLIISLVITGILARHVSPSAFGTMAVATVIMMFLDIFTDIGIGAAIIQFKELTKRQLDSLFMIGLILGILLCALLFWGALPLSKYYNDPSLANVCKLLCICLIFKACNIVPNGLMLRNKRFKTIALRTLSIQIIGGIFAAWAAYKGWGIYALIITPIISSIGVFAINYINYPQRIVFNIDWSAAKMISQYSTFQFLFTFTNYFSRNIDKLIIGKYFSLSDLGYYDKSYRLMQLPLQNITFVISPVLHPILSSLKDNPKELWSKNKKLSDILSKISFPIGLLLYFCANEIINIVFGPNWGPAIPVFKILAFSLPLQIILSTCGSIFLAAGNSNHLFYTGIINTTITVVGFLITAIYFPSIENMAWSWDITLILNFLDSYYVMNRITFRSSFSKYLKIFIPQIINSCITFMICLYIFRLTLPNSLILSLIIKISIIVLITVSIAYLIGQYNILKITKSLLLTIKSKVR